MRHPVLAVRICEWCPSSHVMGFKLWLCRGPWFTTTHGICDSANTRLEVEAQRWEEKHSGNYA